MGNMTDFARSELRESLEGTSAYNREIAENTIALLEVFSAQGHSGFSASVVRNLFARLADFKPIGPLTGEAGEWNEVGEGMFQNRRCSSVFKNKDGLAYDIDARVFEGPDGFRYTSSKTSVDVVFPYTPCEVPIVVKVDEDGNPINQ